MMRNTILIIEDDAGLIELLAEIVEDCGYKAVCILSAEKALDWLKLHKPFFMILDYSLSDMNGAEFITKLKLQKLTLPPFVVTTGQGDERIAVVMMKLGAIDYIIKNNQFLEILPMLIKRVAKEIKNEHALRESNQFNKQIIQSANEGIIVYDAKMKYLVWNPFMEKLSGIQAKEVIGKHPLEVFPFLKDIGLVENIQKALKGESIPEVDFPFYISASEKSGWTSYKTAPLYDTHGEIIGAITTVRDVTERKRNEEVLQNFKLELEMQNNELVTINENLQAATNKYTELYDFAPLGYFTINKDSKILESNFRGASMLGKERLNIRHSVFAMYVSENTKPIFNRFLEDVFRLEIKCSCEIVIESKGNVPRYILMEGIVTETGDRCLLTATDITERKVAEDMVQESKDYLGKIINSIAVPVFVKNDNHEFCLVNNAFCEFHKRSREELLGRTGYEYFPNEQYKVFIAKDNEVYATGKENINEEYITDGLGITRTIITRKTLYTDAVGSRFLVGVINDITERKKLENLLKQTHQNYETFFNTIDDFLFVLDQNGNIVHTNTKVIDEIGYTQEELFGMSILMLHPEERRAEAAEIVVQMLNNEADYCPVPIITKAGVQIPVETRVQHGVWDDKPVVFGVSKDISPIKLSEEKFSKVFYVNPSACGLTDAITGQYFEVNEAFYTVLGFNKDEVIGKTPVDLGILTVESLTDLLIKIDGREKILNLEANLRAKNGDIKQVLLSAEFLFLQDRKFLFTVVHDITLRRNAEDALRQSEEKYRTLLNSSPDGIIILDIDGRISEVSVIALELLGEENRDQLIGKNINELATPDENNAIREIFDRTLSEGLVQNIELKIRKKNQTVFLAEISATLIQSLSGMPLSFMIIVRDISQRRKIEAKQIHADRMANIGQMAAGIAHEINQPLNIISMVLDKIIFEADKTQIIDIEFLKKKSEKIFENIIRIRNIIDHIRSFSRNNDDYVLIAFDINASIESATSLVVEQFKHLGIKLNLQLDQHIPQILGNTHKFEQVMINLLANAKDAVMDKQAKQSEIFDMTITINSYLEDQFLIVEVADNGIGIINDDINNIILPFYTTKDEGKGTGLGLSISYQIIKEMNGNIEITSDVSFGTKVRIVIDTVKLNGKTPKMV